MRIRRLLIGAVVGAMLILTGGAAATATDNYGTICPGGIIVYNTPCPTPRLWQIRAVPDREPNEAGWYRDDVEVTFVCTSYVTSRPITQEEGCPEPAVYSTTGEYWTQVYHEVVPEDFSHYSQTYIRLNIDKDPPTIAPAVTGGAVDGWYKSGPVTVTFLCQDTGGSGLPDNACPAAEVFTADGSSSPHTITDIAGNVSAPATIVPVRIDGTAPTIAAQLSSVPNSYGWFNEPPTVTFTCEDEHAVKSCGPTPVVVGEGAAQTVTGTAIDFAGNSATASISAINVDLTPPKLQIVGGPLHGGVYTPDSLPLVEACLASDSGSMVVGDCVYTPLSTDIGSHTFAATARDKAGNMTTITRMYTVIAPTTISAFARPVDGSGVVNTVKGGSTVPLKFEVFTGGTEVTDVAAIQSLTQRSVACGTFEGSETDAIELTSPGATTLRYDASAGTFVQNWKTPKQKGLCIVVTVTTVDGATRTANFLLT